MAMVLTGTVVTFADDPDVVADGALYVNDGVVEAAQPRAKAAPAGYTKARRVATGGNIYPGLIDLHNHLAYNFLPLWSAPRATPYTSRHQWPGAATYGSEVSNPAQAMGIVAAAAALRYAEVKAAAGGATSIQGSPPLTRAFPGWMVRNVEKQTFADQGDDQLMYQAVIRADVAKLRTYANRLAEGRSFVYHLAEGTDPGLRQEYRDLRTAGCVHPQLIGIHCTALGSDEYCEWGATPGAVVWSPFSNLWLYGDTTDVVEARRRGLLVCLGSDWAPSGTKNMLGELKVAALWNDEALGGALDAREIGALATANPGDALARCWDRDVGRLRPGALADVLVTSRRDPDPYRSLLLANERHVRLVLVGGRPVLGTRSVLSAAGSTGLEALSVGGVAKAVAMRLPDDLRPADPDLQAEADLPWREGMAVMQRVVDDPAAAVRAARAARPRSGAPRLEWVPDMPAPETADGARALDDDELDTLVVPPVETLAHDAAWFRAVDRCHPHAGVLRRLGVYFGR